MLHFPDLIPFFTFIFAMLTTLTAATTAGLLIDLLIPETRCTIFLYF